MSGIFKAYDIRGVYGRDLDETLAEKIGRAYVQFTGAKSVVIARDDRTHSESLFAALAKGITKQGADVIDIGMASTPMSYFANGTYKADGSVMITASHNTAEWNGFKLCRANAVPISGATGIADIQALVEANDFPAATRVGKIEKRDILPEYAAHIAKFSKVKKPLEIAADYANGMGIAEAQALKGSLEIDALYDEYDGAFPNHEANPLKTETLADLQAKIKSAPGKYAFGAAFDGDADRAGFVDELGEIIPMDMITALIAQDMLATAPASVIFYDLRSSRSVSEVIENAGGKPMMSRVGHAFIKQQMREYDALFAGELSGHYYFRDNFTAESSSLAVLAIANIVANSDKPLSELVKPLYRYFQSGEINSRVERDPKEILDQIRTTYANGKVFELDGVSVEFDDFWFNVRCSNTEPLVRLNLEARTAELMAAKRDELLALIRA